MLLRTDLAGCENSFPKLHASGICGILHQPPGYCVAYVVFGYVLVQSGGHELLHSQLHLPFIRIDGENLRSYDLSDSKDVLRMIDSPFRADVAHVDHPFDSFRHLHESAEFRDAGNRAFHRRANFKLLPDVGPGISQGLLEAQRNTALGRIQAEDDGFDDFALFHDVAGLADLAFSPRHFRDVNQAFDAGFEFDKSAKIGEARDRAADAIANFVGAGDGIPGMRLELFQSYGDPALVALGREF